MSLRLAIVGAGWAGVRQAEAARELGRDVEVVCLVDSDAQHVAGVAAELGVTRTHTRLDDLLADPAVDALSICTPHHLHCPMALIAAAAGKHILVEKPIALTVTEATRMIDAAEANGVTLFVAENQAYSKRAHFLPSASPEMIGEPTGVFLAAGFRAQDFGYPGRRAWLTQPEAGGTGTWMLHGVHSMAELRVIFGEVETIYLREHKTDSFVRRDLEGTVSGLLAMRSGLHISIMQSSETHLPDGVGGYLIFGERGCIRAGRDALELYRNDAAPGEQPQTITYPRQPLSEYAQELEAFAQAVLSRKEGLTSGRSERRTLAIVEAGYESIASGAPVDLRQSFGAL